MIKQRKKSGRGSITVEYLIILIPFMLAFFFLLNIARFAEAEVPDVTAYYMSQHDRIGKLYREFGSLWNLLGRSSDNGTYESEFSDALREATLISLGTVSEPDVNIGYGVFGDGVTVTFTHEIPTPGIFKYLGIDVDTTIKSAAYTHAVNPTSFARTINLASD